MRDVIIIGAGVVGSAIARELSRYQLKVTVLERASDVCEGTSKANSGIVHAGYDAMPGTWKARLNVEGNRRMEALAQELDFPFKRNGSMVLSFTEEGRAELETLRQRGIANGVEGLRILDPEEIHALEPHVSPQVKAALYAPTGGIVCPFGLTIALAENACENGVEFALETEVTSIESIVDATGRSVYRVHTGRGDYESRLVINAAGVYADQIHNMVSTVPLHITPRRGEYCLFDKTAGGLISTTLFQLPTKLGKGILLTPTVHGNLLAGPTAEDVDEKEAVDTTREGLSQVLSKAANSVDQLPTREVITAFAGLRAHGDYVNEEGVTDFLIREAEDAPGFIDVAGIESPGLSAAPAIGVYVAELACGIYADLMDTQVMGKEDFHPGRTDIPHMAELSEEEKRRWIRENAAFGHIVCRCEQVTEGEILSAIHRPLGATTLDGVKRRTRAGMGRCQSGFCAPGTVELLARELHRPVETITKAGGQSVFLVGENKRMSSVLAADAADTQNACVALGQEVQA